MEFLHDGRPAVVRKATCRAGGVNSPVGTLPRKEDFNVTLRKILSSYNVCSKEWIIRQYDHEVQGGSVVKPLVGVHEGPGDAAVVLPLQTLRPNTPLTTHQSLLPGLAIGCGMNPHYGDLDPYAMAAAAIDEAARNVVAVGADPRRIALLDNFCWGNTNRPEVLGSLVRAAEACRDLALAYGTPFISGKDSLNNEYRSANQHISIPPTLLISAIGRVPDVRRCVTMDLKEPGNVLFLLGVTRDEMGGSHYHLVHGISGGAVPAVNLELAPTIFEKLHTAIQRGLVRSCHDLSEGGLAVALAEMAFAGGVGADVTELRKSGDHPDATLLFSESATRFVVEVAPANVAVFEACLQGVPLTRLGQSVKEPRLRIAGAGGEWIVWAALPELKEAWQKPLRW
jgi:phosphoribosylformylglycinamidine synthase